MAHFCDFAESFTLWCLSGAFHTGLPSNESVLMKGQLLNAERNCAFGAVAVRGLPAGTTAELSKLILRGAGL
jgi:hypothetical protein